MDAFLPANLPAERVVARVGLISDTHVPERCAALPPSLFEVLRGVDLLLHAGDVGELWVLEHLSAIAPLVAVHGNDDTPDATRELPYQQLVAVGGVRILLWHSHYRDPAQEMASRRSDDWHVRLARWAERGRRAGAQIVVFGHAHIPLTCQYEDVWLVNLGALASGNAFTRQLRQTVALLFIRDDGTPFVTHVDLAVPDRAYIPHIDWEAGFRAALDQYSATIVAPDLADAVARLTQQRFAAPEALKAAVLRVSHRCWAGEQPAITRADLLAEVRGDPEVPIVDKVQVERIFSGVKRKA
jgi:putative phosphoesterase